ncbi:L-aspartate oxidase, chloroplastic [Tanacetum coccineum]|uniref:L-aspartate oxidase, chloroplastic n=1 Tax=Tanacetum coccineum TaxID=301880 RepID=A0ABQ5DWH4_9ASTR
MIVSIGHVVYLPACNIRDIVTQFLTAITSCIRDVSTKYFDFVVICSRVAGLRYALEVAKHGNVAIITKAELHESNTNYAQGGVSDVLCPADSVESHMQDTIVAGAYLCDEETVRVVCTEGLARIRELIAMSASFDHGEDGNLHLAREGGHSHHRIVHAAYMTGREIERALLKAIEKDPNITVFKHHFAIDLLTSQVATGDVIQTWSKKSKISEIIIMKVLQVPPAELEWYLQSRSAQHFSTRSKDIRVWDNESKRAFRCTCLFSMSHWKFVCVAKRYYVYESNINWDGCGKPKIERQVKADALSQEMDSLCVSAVE